MSYEVECKRDSSSSALLLGSAPRVATLDGVIQGSVYKDVFQRKSNYLVLQLVLSTGVRHVLPNCIIQPAFLPQNF